MGTRKRVSDTMVTGSFKDLKKIIRRRRAKAVFKQVAVEEGPPRSDEELFRSRMKDVQEIEEFRSIPVYNKPDVYPSNKPGNNEDIQELLDTVNGRIPLTLSDTQEYVEWIDRDYREDIIGSLHEGRYSVQDCLDLHGLVVEEAEKEVERFIGNALKRSYRCIRIVHGRGLSSPHGPVLKDSVIKWLSGRYRKYVLAFVTARQCDGGLGALYILLK